MEDNGLSSLTNSSGNTSWTSVSSLLSDNSSLQKNDSSLSYLYWNVWSIWTWWFWEKWIILFSHEMKMLPFTCCSTQNVMIIFILEVILLSVPLLPINTFFHRRRTFRFIDSDKKYHLASAEVGHRRWDTRSTTSALILGYGDINEAIAARLLKAML